jgi:hypothetical protein
MIPAPDKHFVDQETLHAACEDELIAPLRIRARHFGPHSSNDLKKHVQLEFTRSPIPNGLRKRSELLARCRAASEKLQLRKIP